MQICTTTFDGNGLGWDNIWSTCISAAGPVFCGFGTFALLGLTDWTLKKALAPQPTQELGRSMSKWLQAAWRPGKGCYGLDGEVFVRYCVLGRNFSLLGGMLGMVMMLVFANGADSSSDFSHFTAANVATPEELWYVVLAAYVLALIFCGLMYREWMEFVCLRREHFVERARCAHPSSDATDVPDAQAMYSVLVERIPSSEGNEDAVREAFERLFPGSILFVGIPHDYFWQYHDKFVREHSGLNIYSFFHCLHKCSKGIAPGVSTAFITFRSLKDRQVALQQASLFRARRRAAVVEDWYILPAPDVRDIIWQNFAFDHKSISGATRFINTLMACYFIFYVSPLAMILMYTDPILFVELAPQAKEWLLNNGFSWVYSWLQVQLPLKIIGVVSGKIPFIFTFIGTAVEHRKRKSEVARASLLRSCFYTLATYYLLAVWEAIAWTVTDFIREVGAQPACIFWRFGSTMPQASVYFIVLLLNYTSGMPWKLLRFNVIWTWMRGKPPSKDPVFFDVASEGCTVAVALMLTTTFSVISPAIMLSSAVFFSVATYVYSWSFANLFGKRVEGSPHKYQEFDSDGGIWLELFQVSMAGLSVSTFTVSGIVMSRVLVLQGGEVTFEVWLLFFACLFLLLGILHFWARCERSFLHYAESMTFEDTIAVDREPGQSSIIERFDGEYYRDPMSKCVDFLYS
eukprot:CAMPEP_0115750128 /NCGR_PEP_ID=MMETSP0272-20121206/94558_1 /TAXON_ID=71861 /ORGANISM="Scrippsiella trochoidea, Strain CCMP3099" /LENGTH=687 /DNA_ID=CAMNT_0003195221 /DNA_START=100 /DNA_END=2160 /DNA_ORIENTATION=-